jgi:thymidylate synthase
MFLETRNVNTAFKTLVKEFHECGSSNRFSTNDSRNGKVIRFKAPVTIRYSQPTERVLFNENRDANPFFHIYEALWMLAGRNDVAPLVYYNSQMKQFSDDGYQFNGAYGYRWRHGYAGVKKITVGEAMHKDYVGYNQDQLSILINHLKENPNSRRAVLNMWNVQDDLMQIESSKDVCCNLNVVFEIRKEYTHQSFPVKEAPIETSYLDMTVFNRSNDLVLGSLGANYVHFTILQH